MKKKIIATDAERAAMDAVDQKQQDSIEEISRRIDSLAFAIFACLIVWGATFIFILSGFSK